MFHEFYAFSRFTQGFSDFENNIIDSIAKYALLLSNASLASLNFSKIYSDKQKFISFYGSEFTTDKEDGYVKIINEIDVFTKESIEIISGQIDGFHGIEPKYYLVVPIKSIDVSKKHGNLILFGEDDFSTGVPLIQKLERLAAQISDLMLWDLCLNKNAALLNGDFNQPPECNLWLGGIYLDLKNNLIIWESENNLLLRFPDYFKPEFNDIINPYFNNYLSERKDVLQIFEYITLLIKDKSEKAYSFSVNINLQEKGNTAIRVDYFREDDFSSIFFVCTSQEEQVDSFEKLEHLVESSDIGGVEFVTSSNQLVFSKAARKILKIDSSLQAINFGSFATRMLRIDPRETLSGLRNVLKYSNQFTTEYELYLNSSDKTTIRVHGKPLFENNSCKKIIGTIQEIVQESFQEHEAEIPFIWKSDFEAFQNICDQANFFILCLDRNLNVSYVNNAVRETFLPSGDHQRKVGVDQLFSADSIKIFKSKLEEMQDSESNQSDFFLAHTHKSNTNLYTEWKLIAVDSSMHEASKFLLVGINLTKHYQNIPIFEEMVTELSHQKKRFREFSHLISHEIRSHVANIQGLLSIMGYIESEKERGEYFEYFKTAVCLLDEALFKTNSILSLQNHLPLHWESFSLNLLLDEVIASFSVEFLTNGFTIDLADFPDLRVFSNQQFIKNILNELIAVFLMYRSVIDKPVIKIRVRKSDNGYFSITLKDNGSSYEILKNINSNLTLKSSNPRIKDSVNSGLFIINNQIESLNGYVVLEKHRTESASISLFFPYEEV